jgi:RHS repeat-associated protein
VSGSVVARHDYMPFGEEISSSQRTSAVGYSGDSVRKQFTGYERDSETNLDSAGSRMYAKDAGRFTSTDPYTIVLQKEKGKNAKEKRRALEGYIMNPQVWDRYAYVLDRPLAMTDEGGNCSEPKGLQPGQTGICVEAYIASPVLCKIGCLVGGFGDNRGRSGTDVSLTNRVQTELIISKKADGGSHIGGETTVNYSIAFQFILPEAPTLPPLYGSATTNITNASVDGDGTTRFNLAVTALNGATVNGLPGPSDIEFDFNIAVTQDGKVTVEGGSAKKYPTIDIYGYTKDANGNTNVQDNLPKFPEQSPDDLEKPKQPIPTSTPN